MKTLKDIVSNLPSFVYVILIPAVIAAFIGSIILVFYLLSNVEGFGSILVLVIGGYLVYTFTKPFDTSVKTTVKDKGSAFAVAVGVSFFALMGAVIDQPGNFIYNKPIEYIFCENGSTLDRDITILHPLPGRTDVIQDFTCFDSSGEATKSIHPMLVLLVRFFEYVLICYALIYISKGIHAYKSRSHSTVKKR